MLGRFGFEVWALRVFSKLGALEILVSQMRVADPLPQRV